MERPSAAETCVQQDATLETHTGSHADVAPLLPHARIVHRHPVFLPVAVGVLEITAARASRLRVVDEVFVADLIDERIGERAERELVDILRVEQVTSVDEE